MMIVVCRCRQNFKNEFPTSHNIITQCFGSDEHSSLCHSVDACRRIRYTCFTQNPGIKSLTCGLVLFHHPIVCPKPNQPPTPHNPTLRIHLIIHTHTRLALDLRSCRDQSQIAKFTVFTLSDTTNDDGVMADDENAWSWSRVANGVYILYLETVCETLAILASSTSFSISAVLYLLECEAPSV